MIGLSGCALAASAYHSAVQYCSERIQGRPTANPKSGRCAIIKHEDVKRMLRTRRPTSRPSAPWRSRPSGGLDIENHSTDPSCQTGPGLLDDQTPVLVRRLRPQCSPRATATWRNTPPAALPRREDYPIWEGTKESGNHALKPGSWKQDN